MKQLCLSQLWLRQPCLLEVTVADRYVDKPSPYAAGSPTCSPRRRFCWLTSPQAHSTAAALTLGMDTQPRVPSYANLVPRTHVPTPTGAGSAGCLRTPGCTSVRTDGRDFPLRAAAGTRGLLLAAQGISVPCPRLSSQTVLEKRRVCHHPSPREVADCPTQPPKLTHRRWQCPSKAPFQGLV